MDCQCPSWICYGWPMCFFWCKNRLRSSCLHHKRRRLALPFRKQKHESVLGDLRPNSVCGGVPLRHPFLLCASALSFSPVLQSPFSTLTTLRVVTRASSPRSFSDYVFGQDFQVCVPVHCRWGRGPQHRIWNRLGGHDEVGGKKTPQKDTCWFCMDIVCVLFPVY